jgi:hypothetical protein
MKVKVAEATNIQLDWMVAMVLGAMNNYPDLRTAAGFKAHQRLYPAYCYTRYWEQGGPIIEREKISVSNPNGDPGWIGSKATPAKPKRNGTPQWTHKWECGPTPLIAAMRCFVASKLGDEVEVPDELS